METTKTRGRCLVRGIGDVGSAVAHALFRIGWLVAVHDEPAPTAHRRRMAFVDAAFDGIATLDGVTARRIDMAEQLAAAVERHDEIPVWVGTFDTLLRAAPWDVLIDARMRKRATAEPQRGLAPLTVGLGPGFVAGETIDLVIETGWHDLGAVIRSGPTAPLHGEPSEIDGHRRDRLIYAPRAGRLTSARAIGDLVTAGEAIVTIDDLALMAPLSGAIRGLTRSGVSVAAGTKIVEIDPRGRDAVFTGLGERPRRVAEGVVRAVAQWPASPADAAPTIAPGGS